MIIRKLILLCAFSICGFFCGCDGKTIERQVAEDVEKQYELAVKGGDKIEIAVNAGLVAEAYKQAHDEENYLKWKKIENDAKNTAGLVIP